MTTKIVSNISGTSFQIFQNGSKSSSSEKTCQLHRTSNCVVSSLNRISKSLIKVWYCGSSLFTTVSSTYIQIPIRQYFVEGSICQFIKIIIIFVSSFYFTITLLCVDYYLTLSGLSFPLYCSHEIGLQHLLIFFGVGNNFISGEYVS